MNNSRKPKQSVFTPVNLIIAATIITIILIIGLDNLLENPANRQIRQTAEKQLRLFARGYSLDAIDCEGIDSNENGWVNCRADDRQGQTVYLECPYQVTDQECRYREKN
ncbi:hypothetical protein cce_1518 [Crocosphaera subtropica ATCC 51142]|uniref:Uncharacterized protein n=1 Tax=Crocosphaera subtropica (strain ATCC 51142 / BH68) TaxID=43989 RepID=B1WXC4_CROS5|nr:hypothetical protein [Crocosphaera subtropica]ACB50868.1 hypothetical protein cce_1518 [Crocosphaera subtropica ATCC 51142]